MDIRTHRWCHRMQPYTRYMYRTHHVLHDVHIPVIQATLPLDPDPRQLQDITGQTFKIHPQVNTEFRPVLLGLQCLLTIESGGRDMNHHGCTTKLISPSMD